MSTFRTAKPRLTKDIRRRILAHLADRDGARCYYCSCPFADDLSDATLDHYVPYCLWPENRPRNLVLACRPCNQDKADRLPWWVVFLLSAAPAVTQDVTAPVTRPVTLVSGPAVNTPGPVFTIPPVLFTTHGTRAWQDLFDATVYAAVTAADQVAVTKPVTELSAAHGLPRPVDSIESTDESDPIQAGEHGLNTAEQRPTSTVLSPAQWRVLARLARACEAAVNTDRPPVNSRERSTPDRPGNTLRPVGPIESADQAPASIQSARSRANASARLQPTAYSITDWEAA